MFSASAVEPAYHNEHNIVKDVTEGYQTEPTEAGHFVLEHQVQAVHYSTLQARWIQAEVLHLLYKVTAMLEKFSHNPATYLGFR